MADVRSRLFDWSTNASSNLPSGTTVVGAGADDNFQQIQATVRAELASKGFDIPSSATLDLSVAGSAHDITGNSTITGAGSVSAGMWKVLQFNSSAVLKHSASLILPSKADITAQPGDCLFALSLGSGSWRVPFYQKADGRPFADLEVVGVIKAYAGTTAPSGYLLCDGSAVSRTTYSALFAVTSTTYGTGDGSTTFNLPDLRGRAVFGVDNMGGTTASRVTNGTSGIVGTTLGAAGGSQSSQAHTHTGTTSSNGLHTHTWNRTDTSGGSAGGMSGLNVLGTSLTSSDGAHTHTFTSDSTGAGNSQNMPPAIMLNYIIKT